MEALFTLLAGILIGKSKITKTATTVHNLDGSVETIVTIDKNSTLKQAGDIIIRNIESIQAAELEFAKQIMIADGNLSSNKIEEELNTLRSDYNTLLAHKRSRYYGTPLNNGERLTQN